MNKQLSKDPSGGGMGSKTSIPGGGGGGGSFPQSIKKRAEKVGG